MIENRRSYRLPFRTKFVFSTRDRVITGNSSNISAGGIFVTTLESGLVKRDGECHCLFLLNEFEAPICTQAIVKRVVAQTANPEEIPGLAFNFVATESADIERLNDFMDVSRRNFEVAATILSSGEPDLLSLEPLVSQMHLPPIADLSDLRFFVERILKAIELVDRNSA